MTFASGGIYVNCSCWYKETTPIEKGRSYEAAATRMETKKDTVTKEKRPGIFLKEFGARGIFLHEGKDATWSDNCVVLPRDQMLTIWEHIEAQGDLGKYVVAVKVS